MTESRSRKIIDRARADPAFRDQLIRVGALRDAHTYPAMGSWMELGPALLRFAESAGLLDGIDGQGAVDEVMEWLQDNIDELAFYAQRLKKLPPGRWHARPVGQVFLSWTVKNPRGRASMLGIKKALEHFNIKYFDYTERQLDDSRDASGQIEAQLEAAIGGAIFSIESVSVGVGSPWIQWERERLRKSGVRKRILICLEREAAALMQIAPDEERRVVRVDFSGGRSAGGATRDAAQWMAGEADTRGYFTPDYFLACHALAWDLRHMLEHPNGAPWWRDMIEAFTVRKFRDSVDFVKKAMQA